jgi:uncharacterized membrane protein YkvA (DUF1232 family)
MNVPLLLWILLGVAVAAVVAVAAGWLTLRWLRRSLVVKAFGPRLAQLSFRQKLGLAWALMRDPRIPLLVRAIPVLLVLYLAMPLDFIPDFLPVIGQLDDLLILVIGVGLIVRFVPRAVLESQIARAEGTGLAV